MLLLLALACPRARVADPDEGPLVVLVSMDGSRWDMPARAGAPHLDALAAEGVRAEALRPPFPSKTFPSHYSMVTGLTPDVHGLIENTLYDPARDAWYTITDPVAVSDPRWYGGEPIWATARAAGLRSATVFWVGSEAPIGGVQPDLWLPYDGGMDLDARVDQALAWLDRPSRPHLLTVYLDEPDHAGHAHGPDAPEVDQAMARADAALGRLIQGLQDRDLFEDTDLIVVSDHGMARLSPDRVVFVDELIDLREVEVITWTPMLSMFPAGHGADDPGAEEGHVDALLEQLSASPHMACARKEDLPPALGYGQHPLVPPLVCLAEAGWTLGTRAFIEANPEIVSGGTHGWPPDDPDMGGLFVARGPSFARGVTHPPFDNIELYNLLAHALGVSPAPNQGELSRLGGLLAEP